jgi:hypothetical protein
MTQQQILALVGGIRDLHDLRLMYVGIFFAVRGQVKFWAAVEVVDGEWRAS